MTFLARFSVIITVCSLLFGTAAQASNMIVRAPQSATHTADSLDQRAARLVRLMTNDLLLDAQQQQMMLYYLRIQLHELRANVQAGAMSSEQMASEGRKRLNELVENILSARQREVLPAFLEIPRVYACLQSLKLQI